MTAVIVLIRMKLFSRARFFPAFEHSMEFSLIHLLSRCGKMKNLSLQRDSRTPAYSLQMNANEFFSGISFIHLFFRKNAFLFFFGKFSHQNVSLSTFVFSLLRVKSFTE
jgi:hypothetical protein